MSGVSPEINGQARARQVVQLDFSHRLGNTLSVHPESYEGTEGRFDALLATLSNTISNPPSSYEDMGYKTGEGSLPRIELLADLLRLPNLARSMSPSEVQVIKSTIVGLDAKRPVTIWGVCIRGMYGWNTLSSINNRDEVGKFLYIEEDLQSHRLQVKAIDLGYTKDSWANVGNTAQTTYDLFLAGERVRTTAYLRRQNTSLTLQRVNIQERRTEQDDSDTEGVPPTNFPLEVRFKDIPEAHLNPLGYRGLSRGFHRNFEFANKPHYVNVGAEADDLRMGPTPFFVIEAGSGGLLQVGLPNRLIVPFAYELEQSQPQGRDNAYVEGEHLFFDQANSTSGLSALVNGSSKKERGEWRSAHYQVELDAIFQLFEGNSGISTLQSALGAQNEIAQVQLGDGVNRVFRSAQRYQVDDRKLPIDKQLFVYDVDPLNIPTIPVGDPGMQFLPVTINVAETIKRLMPVIQKAKADMRAGDMDTERMEEIARLGERLANFVNLPLLVKFIHDEQ